MGMTIEDFEKYPSCCLLCPYSILANNSTHYCRYLDKYVQDEKKRMDDCPFEKKERSMYKKGE